MRAMRDALNLSGVVFLDADEQCDCVVVGIADAAAGSDVERFAASAGLPAGRVRIISAQPFRPLASLRDGIRPVKGGLQIGNTDRGMCTLGFVARSRDRGTLGLVTNSHCTRSRSGVDGIDFFQAGTALFSSDYVATEVVDPPLRSSDPGCPIGKRCRFSDAAFAEFKDQSVGVLGRIAAPTKFCGSAKCDVNMSAQSDELTIAGVAGAATVGERRMKIGRTTGWTGGVVTRSCVSVNVADDNGAASDVTMLCQAIVDGASGKGDSGSPVFQLLQNNRVVLAGILWGGGGDDFVFSPLPAVERELGPFDVM